MNRLLIVSFDIVEAGTKVWNVTGQTCKWGDTYTFRSSERRVLTYNTAEGLSNMGLDVGDYCVDSEIVSRGTYRYSYWDLPEFLITKVIRKGMKGVERE